MLVFLLLTSSDNVLYYVVDLSYIVFLSTHIDIRGIDVVGVWDSIFRFQNHTIVIICNPKKPKSLRWATQQRSSITSGPDS